MKNKSISIIALLLACVLTMSSCSMLLTNGRLSGAINFPKPPEPPDYSQRRIDMSTFSFDDPRLYEEFVAGLDRTEKSTTALVACINAGLLGDGLSAYTIGTLAVHGSARMFDVDSITLDVYYSLTPYGVDYLDLNELNDNNGVWKGKPWAELYFKCSGQEYTIIDYPELPTELIKAIEDDSLRHRYTYLDDFLLDPITITIPAEAIEHTSGGLAVYFKIYRERIKGDSTESIELSCWFKYAVIDGKFIVTDYYDSLYSIYVLT